MSKSLNNLLADAVAHLAVANDELVYRVTLARAASREETFARNKVNEAQKVFDDLVATVKKTAPVDTDWRKPVRVDCQVGLLTVKGTVEEACTPDWRTGLEAGDILGAGS